VLLIWGRCLAPLPAGLPCDDRARGLLLPLGLDCANVSRKHLHRYVAEFDFRWNARKVDDGERQGRAVRSAEGKQTAVSRASCQSSRNASAREVILMGTAENAVTYNGHNALLRANERCRTKPWPRPFNRTVAAHVLVAILILSVHCRVFAGGSVGSGDRWELPTSTPEFTPGEEPARVASRPNTIKSPDGRYVLTNVDDYGPKQYVPEHYVHPLIPKHLPLNVDPKDYDPKHDVYRVPGYYIYPHEPEHSVYLKDNKDGHKSLLYRYGRSAEILWSPDYKGLIINDLAGSNVSYAILFDMPPRPLGRQLDKC
jgi:hypothetical protein